MAMDKEKKKEVLLEKFEIIKDNYDKNREAMTSIVVKMMKIDIETAVEMWIYLISKYESIIKHDDSYALICGILYEGENAIGEGRMYESVIGNPFLKNFIFNQAGGDISIYVACIIRKMIEINELSIADELLSLVYGNKYMDNSFYEVLDDIIPDDVEDMEISEEAYELLESWCDKVKGCEERAKLSIKMIDYMDLF